MSLTRIRSLDLRRRKHHPSTMTAERAFQSAKTDNLTADWLTTIRSIDADTRNALPQLRARSRELEQNNDYAKRFLSLLVNNVIGHNGIKLQMKVRDTDLKLDKDTNAIIEDSWNSWGEFKTPTIDGTLSFHDLEQLVMKAVARDGEVLIHHIRGYIGNKWRYAVQVLDADLIDTDHDNITLSNGNTVRMGVELNSERRPVAYYILTSNPGDTTYIFTASRKHVRIPAENIEHIFLPFRISQTRGIPWMHASMYGLNMIGAYDQAEVIAARLGASKMGFYKSENGARPNADDEDAQGNLVQNATPGTFETLPAGVSVETFDPNHPSGNYEPFKKAALRGLASGMDVSYHALASDLEGVSFSSIRQGVLDERNCYRIIQRFIASRLNNIVFNAWFPFALITDLSILNFNNFDRLNRPRWIARGWPWVDPKKDAESAVLQINNKLNSRTNILAEKGLDFEDVLDQLQAEEESIKARGMTVPSADADMFVPQVNDEEDD